jgi:hypothetical protein
MNSVDNSFGFLYIGQAFLTLRPSEGILKATSISFKQCTQTVLRILLVVRGGSLDGPRVSADGL